MPPLASAISWRMFGAELIRSLCLRSEVGDEKRLPLLFVRTQVSVGLVGIIVPKFRKLLSFGNLVVKVRPVDGKVETEACLFSKENYVF